MTIDEPVVPDAPVVGFIFGPGFSKSEASTAMGRLSAVCAELGITFGEGMDLARRYLGTGQVRTLDDLLRVGAYMQSLRREAGL
jgi:hypothetical protein